MKRILLYLTLFILFVLSAYMPAPACGIDYDSILRQSEEEYNRLFYDSLANAYEKQQKKKSDSGSRLAEVSLIICRNLFSDTFPDKASYYRYLPSITELIREKQENRQVLFIGEGNLLPPYRTVSVDTLALELSGFQPEAVFWGANYQTYPPEYFSEDSDLFLGKLTGWDTPAFKAGINAYKYVIKDIPGARLAVTSIKNTTGETLPSSYYLAQGAGFSGSFPGDVKIFITDAPQGLFTREMSMNYSGMVLLDFYPGIEYAAAKSGNNLEISFPDKAAALWEITLLVKGTNTIVHWNINRVPLKDLVPDDDFASALEGRELN